MKAKIVLAVLIATVLLFFTCQSDNTNSWEINRPDKVTELIFFGDSLTAGYGLSDKQESFPHKVAQHLKLPFKAFGYSGYTTGRAIEKLPQIPSANNAIVIVTLGGNDILKNRPLNETEANLRKIISHLQKAGHTVVYTEVLSLFDGKRHQMHLRVCEELKIAMVPDILQGLITDPDMMQSDSIHPAAPGCTAIALKITDTLLQSQLIP